jgi:hypothetical protein
MPSRARALGLLELEEVVRELLLQLLVGKVDEQLLQAVRPKALEAEDVKHANRADRRLRAARGRGDVDAADHPGEEPRVDHLRQHGLRLHGLCRAPPSALNVLAWLAA